MTILKLKYEEKLRLGLIQILIGIQIRLYLCKCSLIFTIYKV